MTCMAIYRWSEEDEAFVAEVPDLPGCMADGATLEELRSNLQIIVREWMETARSLGRPIPSPSDALEADLRLVPAA